MRRNVKIIFWTSIPFHAGLEIIQLQGQFNSTAKIKLYCLSKNSYHISLCIISILRRLLLWAANTWLFHYHALHVHREYQLPQFSPADNGSTRMLTRRVSTFSLLGVAILSSQHVNISMIISIALLPLQCRLFWPLTLARIDFNM